MRRGGGPRIGRTGPRYTLNGGVIASSTSRRSGVPTRSVATFDPLMGAPRLIPLPSSLAWLERSSAGRAWLARLPERIAACIERWSVRLEAPYEGSVVSIVFPATRADGTRVVLKLQYPHRESDLEAEALRTWGGAGCVLLLDHYPEHHALLLEHCEPGEHLSRVGGDEALTVLIGILP